MPWPSGQSCPAATSAARTRSRSASVSVTSMRGSRRAAAPIRAAGPLTLAGGRRSSSSAAASGEATAQPTRSDAKPKAFESVRRTIRFGCSAISGTQVAPAYS